MVVKSDQWGAMNRVMPRWTVTEDLSQLITHVLVTLDNTDEEYAFALEMTHEEQCENPDVLRERARKAGEVLMADYRRRHGSDI